MCSVFDEDSLRFYQNNFYKSLLKIPSGEITNYFLLNKINIAKSKVILSTGMSNIKEIAQAINVIPKVEYTI